MVVYTCQRKKGRVKFTLRNLQTSRGEKLPIRVVSKYPLHNPSFQTNVVHGESNFFIIRLMMERES